MESSERDDKGSERREREPWERDRGFKRRIGRNLEAPKRGHTVYVHGHSMEEEMVRRSFSKIGKIVNLKMEPEKRCLTVRFSRYDSYVARRDKVKQHMFKLSTLLSFQLCVRDF